jgi:prepilin-type N-terminal cleavage/methylation domain-containing protein
MSRNLKETRRYSRGSRGFTLAELLVALFVMSIIFALVGTLLRSFILQTGRTRYTYAERAMKFHWLNSAVSSVFYYVIKTPDRLAADEKREFIEFFDGLPESMVFITSSPLTLKGVVLARLYFQDGAIYLNETPIFSPNNDYADPRENDETRQTRIIEKIRGVTFTYLKRPQPVRGTGRAATGGFQAIGMSLADARDSSAKIIETDRLFGEIPAGVKLSVTFDDDRKMDYCFKVQSDFVGKKVMTDGNYHQF